MKIRTGFVSNSSSSSFLIAGRTVDREDIPNLRERAKKLHLPIPYDNRGYDPRNWCGCGGEDKECSCQNYEVVAGYGISSDPYGLSYVNASEMKNWMNQALELFENDQVQIFFGVERND